METVVTGKAYLCCKQSWIQDFAYCWALAKAISGGGGFKNRILPQHPFCCSLAPQGFCSVSPRDRRASEAAVWPACPGAHARRGRHRSCICY